MRGTFITGLATVLLALQAGAAPKVSLLKFTGPRGPQARTALVATLCKRVECVEPELVTTRFVPDWQKASGLGVSFMVEGIAVRGGGTVELTLSLLKDGQSTGVQKVEALKDGLAEAVVSKVVDAWVAEIEPSAAPVVKKEPAPAPAPASVPVAVQPAAPEVVAAAPEFHAARRQYSFAGELGVNAYNRTFDYLGALVPTLRRYSLPLVALLTARLEWFPFAAGSGALQGLGFELGGNVAPWIRSAPPLSTNSLPTHAARTDLAVQLRVRAGNLVIIPVLGARLHTFTVLGTTADGATIDGLPNLVYVAVRAGVGGELRLNERFTVFARVAALPLLSSQLISPQFFPRGGAVGIEATAGAGFTLFPGVAIRLSADWTRYLFWFDTNLATSELYARGAYDQYLGATALVRFEL